MKLPDSSSYPWWQALTLTELTKTLPKGKGTATSQGRARLKRWRESLPNLDGEGFKHRLEAAGTSEELVLLLEEPARKAIARDGETPPFANRLVEAYADPDGFATLPLPEDLRDKQGTGFIQLAAPLIHQELKQLEREVHGLLARRHDLPFDSENLGRMLLAPLLPVLASMTERIDSLELLGCGLNSASI